MYPGRSKSNCLILKILIQFQLKTLDTAHTENNFYTITSILHNCRKFDETFPVYK